MNCHAQCRTCNRFDEGRKDRYKEFMLNEYGQQHVDLLLVRKNTSKKWSMVELLVMVTFFKSTVKDMKEKKGER